MSRLSLATVLALAGTAPALAAGPALPPTPVYRLPPERVGEPAFVQVSRSGFYVGTVTGAAFLRPQRSRFDPPTTGLVLRTDYEVAAYAAGRLGYAFDPLFGTIHPRVEAEVGYASSAVDRYRIGTVATPRVDSFGEARALQGYVNVMFDMDVGLPVRPYVGGGVGAARVQLRRQGTSAAGVVVDAADTGFAYHLDAGVNLDLAQLGTSPLLQGTTVELGYRWTQAPDLRFGTRDGGGFEADYQSNAVTLGTRKSF